MGLRRHSITNKSRRKYVTLIVLFCLCFVKTKKENSHIQLSMWEFFVAITATISWCPLFHSKINKIVIQTSTKEKLRQFLNLISRVSVIPFGKQRSSHFDIWISRGTKEDQIRSVFN